VKQYPSMILAAVAAMLLAACSKTASIESVESLVANPERLKELRAQCKADHAKVGDDQCNAVGEATRRRFFGSGGPKYTPATPTPATSAPAHKE
jgi:conjugative transfer region protein TrbK